LHDLGVTLPAAEGVNLEITDFYAKPLKQLARHKELPSLLQTHYLFLRITAHKKKASELQRFPTLNDLNVKR